MVIITRAAYFAVFTTSAGANSVQLQQVSLTIQPQSPVLPGCPMLSARGGQTTLYTTAPATFSLQDFLPSSTAILAYVGVGVSILGGCDTPNSYALSLNARYRVF